LDKPLIDRAYSQDPAFLNFRNVFFVLSPMASMFFLEEGRSLVNVNRLRLGMDIDLDIGQGFALKTMGFKMKYLNDFRNLKDYYNKQVFADLELQTLLQDLERLEGIKKTLVFYKPAEVNKDIIDNPLKVLDFIKDINKPEFKVQADFIKFEGQYLDSSAIVDKSPGFKPQFNFDIKINLDIK